MAAPREVLDFDPAEPVTVIDRMAALAAAHEGWINFEPVPLDDRRPAGGMFGAFAARGPAIPLCTWVPARIRRGRTTRQSLGVQHATGTRAAARLRDLGHPVPTGWLVTQDHPRRGLVVEPPGEEPPARVLAWLLTAGAGLCLVEVTGRWVARVFAGPA